MKPRTIAALLALAMLISGLTWWQRQPVGSMHAVRLSPPEDASASGVAAKKFPLAAKARNPAEETLRKSLRALFDRRDARPHEGILTFANASAYQQFLARADGAGFNILGRLDAFRSVRVRFDQMDTLQRDLFAHASDYALVAPNFIFSPPEAPDKENRTAGTEIPFGNSTLNFLGVPTTHDDWGRGTTIAILDSGVAPDATFGHGRLTSIDVGLGTAPSNGAEDGHGTAIAALAAGSATDAGGVAPGANLLSIRVTDATGQSDIFTVAQAIVSAVDAGAKVLNLSLGGYGTTAALDSAIGYATDHGAVIVAAAGNDQAAQLTWPAADPRVVSVGAVDAAGQQVLFSNSGPQLQFTAPGYGVQTAWLDGQRVTVDGTSASSPLVAGAIAAMLSQNPELTPAQAVKVLQGTANDAGAPGQDPAYGYGTLNLAWAMNRNNPAYTDTAIASHYYDAANSELDVTVQNRGGTNVGGLQLQTTTNGITANYAITSLAAGGTTIVKVPVDTAALNNGTVLNFSTELLNPVGVTDQVPGNNRRSSTLSAAKK